MRNAVRQVRNASKLGCCDIVGGAQHSAPGCMLRAILCPIRSIGSIALHSCPSKAEQLSWAAAADAHARWRGSSHVQRSDGKGGITGD